MDDTRAIIFDCDGTLADTMPSHYEAWMVVLDRYQLTMDEDRFYALGGWPTRKVAELLVREAGRPVDIDRLVVEKEALFEDLVHLVRPIPPVLEVDSPAPGKAADGGGHRRGAADLPAHLAADRAARDV